MGGDYFNTLTIGYNGSQIADVANLKHKSLINQKR